MYNICYVGCGPSTIFSVLDLIEKGYKGDILILEKGKSLKTRPRSEAVSGTGGAGTFSDGKLSSALDVGGIIDNLTEEELTFFEEKIVNTYNKFNFDEKLMWSETQDFDTSNTTLHWNKHKTLHMGSDRSAKINLNIENFITSQNNITFYTEEEVEDISKESNIFIVKTNKDEYTCEKVVIATGRFGMLPPKVIKSFGLTTKPRPFQLGIRVEDITNSDYEKVIKANYDFKFVKNYNIDGVKIRVRTFCANSSRAHVALEEHPKEGFTSFNGHAFHNGETNPTVNYGIVAECIGLDNWFYNKTNQVELMKELNNNQWKEDNFKVNNGKGRLLLEDFISAENKNSNIKKFYPKQIQTALADFINNLNCIIDLSKAHYFYPEIKLSSTMPKMTENFETEVKGLYMIGDCSVSGSIVKAAITGLMMNRGL